MIRFYFNTLDVESNTFGNRSKNRSDIVFDITFFFINPFKSISGIGYIMRYKRKGYLYITGWRFTSTNRNKDSSKFVREFRKVKLEKKND